jgi:RimJ/RimL family protein N-acetyltransferase
MSGISFRPVEAADAGMILGWRTQPRVDRFMTGEVNNDLAAQQAWLESCTQRADYCHWILQIAGVPAGLVSLAQYSAAAGTASWGFYIGEEEQLGFGGFVPPHFYNWAFGLLGLSALHIEVFFNNTAVIELHQLHGYRFAPAADRVIHKAGKEVLLVAMVLERERWNGQRYRRFNAAFPTAHWPLRPAHLSNDPSPSR